MMQFSFGKSDQKVATARRHLQARQWREAEALSRQVLTAEPNNAAAMAVLGEVAFQTGHMEDAWKLLKRTTELMPGDAQLWTLLGAVALNRGMLDDMCDCFQRATALAPANPLFLCNLGYALGVTGKLDESITVYRKAVAAAPAYQPAYSSILNGIHFHPAYDATAIYKEHREWNERIALPLTRAALSHRNDRSPERRLRVGYVSPNFRQHAVGRFMLPIFRNHDTSQVEVFAYSDLAAPDQATSHFRSLAHHWRPIAGMPDDQVAALIRQDNIDVLVDLTMHLYENRMLVFARKPAPVQITYLAYCGTTGLTAIDYRLSDPLIDPPGSPDEQFYSEKTLRLTCYWCYDKPGDIQPAPLPAVSRDGRITFGCLNNFAKLNPGVIETWAKILASVPTSRLLLHAPPGKHRQEVVASFTANGISPDRIAFLAHLPRENYLAAYHQIDIALDPFPHAGGTTTCDALYMGVPVISLRGKTAVGRGGVTILNALGLPELIAETHEQYIATAATLAADIPRLTALHQNLRSRMEASPLMDAPRFTRDLENVYREAWRQWCR